MSVTRLFMPNRSLLNKEGITNFAPLSAREVTMVDGRMRAERLQIMLDPDELAALDDFRFKRRMPSRASAIRELLKRGLAAEGFSAATPRVKSADYGVIGKAPTA